MSGAKASVLSISLDVVDSTDIKSKLAEFSGEHGTDLNKLYSEFAKMMMLSMNRFMGIVDLDTVLDINRLFLIKRIGDEYWYVYKLNGLEQQEVTRHSTHMVQTLLAFFSKSPFEVVATCPEEPDDQSIWDMKYDVLMRKVICWKSTIDLLGHAVDLAKLAEDKLNEFLASLTVQGKGMGIATEGDEELLALKNRLGVGFNYVREDKVAHAMRSDFIGLEVDRFFRMSKFAEEGKILVGKEFLSSLMMEATDTSGKYMFREPFGSGSFTTAINGANVKHTIFSEREIKGIAGGYAGAYIFDEYPAAKPYCVEVSPTPPP